MISLYNSLSFSSLNSCGTFRPLGVITFILSWIKNYQIFLILWPQYSQFITSPYLYLIFYNSRFSPHLEFPYISVVHVDITLLCMFRINISLFAPIHNSLGLHIPYLNQRPVLHSAAWYIFLIFPLIFMSHYETRGIFPISPNSSLCVYGQT